MATITTGTMATRASLFITNDLTGGTPVFSDDSGVLAVTCIQDITMTNSTGVFSYTTFCSVDTEKLPAPADNSISTNVVIDDIVWFGADSGATAGSAQAAGISELANTKTKIGFRIYWNDRTGAGSTSKYTQGVGYITNLAPTTSPDSPIWVSPLEIAVSGGFTDAVGAI
jgi:hypothetical protein